MARGSTAMILVAIGVLAMMTLADCSAEEDDSFARQARGILLRTWRTVQQLEKQHKRQRFYDSAEAYYDEPTGYVRMAEENPLIRHGEFVDPSLHEKRTPPSKNFLGMRGKKNSLDDDYEPVDYEDYGRLVDEPVDVQRDLLKTLLPKNKKMDSHTFLGMRGKKRWGSLVVGPQVAHYHAQQQGMNKKRVPAPHSFMGMRGKRRPSDQKSDYI